MKNDNLLNDFEDKYLANKKRRMIRYLIIGGVSISVIAIIIIIIVAAQNDNKSDNGNNEEQEQENPKNPEKDLEEEEEKKEKEEEEEKKEKEEEESGQPTSGCPEIKLVKGEKQEVAMQQDIGIAVNQVVLGQIMQDRGMKQDNVIKI